MYVCYVLKSTRSTRTYVGITNHFSRRLRQHNGELKGGAKYTRSHRPWELTYMVGHFPDKSTAMKFEWQVKYRSKRQVGSPRVRRIRAIQEAIAAGTPCDVAILHDSEMPRTSPSTLHPSTDT